MVFGFVERMAADSVSFKAREVTVAGQVTQYRIHEPATGGRLPVILFLHGAGESGRDGVRQTTVGLGPAVQKNPERWPALVVFPQASRGYGWRGFNLAAAVAALQDVEQHYETDPDRVYVTGISMGGYGTWLAALLEPSRFAAIVPICGGLDAATAVSAGALTGKVWPELYGGAAKTLKHVPQWVFHGDADDIIPVDESRAMVGALKAAGADVRYSEYPGVRHNSWDPAYAEPELPAWLLAQTRRV
jgi:predicted peptidase